MTDIPSAFDFIQQESFQFNNPVSESSLTAVGATVNGLLSIVLPVGSVVASMLTEGQFQTEIGNLSAPFIWILADGRNVAGSTYNTVTGNTTVPDLRAVFVRGKDNGRGLNPDGNLALGTFTAAKFASHTHGVTDPGHSHGLTQPRGCSDPGGGNQAPPSDGAFSINPIAVASATTGVTVNSTGGNDTSPMSVTLNYFIRIN